MSELYERGGKWSFQINCNSANWQFIVRSWSMSRWQLDMGAGGVGRCAHVIVGDSES